MNDRKFAAIAVLLALSGACLTSACFNADSPWFFIGLLFVILAAMGGACAYFAGKRGTVDDAYEMGYQAGFRKGERVRPKVIRLEPARERERRRSPTPD